MMTRIQKAFWICLISAISMLMMGCSHEAKQAKVPTGVGKHQARTAVKPTQLPQEAPTSVQPAPSQEEVKYEKIFYIELSAMGRPVEEGEEFHVNYDRMIFLRDVRMAPDCSNVQANNLYVQSKGSICQVGILPLEQGFKPGSRKTATWRVGTETRTFSFEVVSDRH